MPKATATVSRLSPTAIAASGIARRTTIRTRKVTKVIAAITQGIRSRVMSAVVVELGGAAGDAGLAGRVVGQRAAASLSSCSLSAIEPGELKL